MNPKENSAKPDLAKLEGEYNALHWIAELFCKELTNQIVRVLDDEGIALGFPIQSRVKAWTSLAEKFDRVRLKATSVKEVQDLVGLRLILLFKRDIRRVCQQIEKNFTIVRQYNTQERLKENQFGYSSIHFVIEIPEQWLAVPTLAPMRGLRAEIQVRTVAQHIWAEASHALQYKSKESVPATVTRAIHRVSALLETVDLEFERVLEQRETYRTELDTTGTEAILNVDLLEKTLDAVLPPQNKDDSEDYADLLEDLSHFGIKTTDDLRRLIDRHLKSALKVDSARVASERELLEADERLITSTAERLRAGVFYTHTGLTRKVLSEEFPEAWENYQVNMVDEYDYFDEEWGEEELDSENSTDNG